MSVVLSPMYTNQVNPTFAAGSRPAQTQNFGQIFASFKPRIASGKTRSASPPKFSSSAPSAPLRKRRTHSDESNVYGGHANQHAQAQKRPKTAPASPSQHSSFITDEAPEKITLPSISDTLKSITSPTGGRLHPPKPLVPTVSLDYFDTYKPNDENWRYGLLDTIRSSRPAFSLEKYASAKLLPSIHEFGKNAKPRFDSRVSSKALPTLFHRKINFPYESNYTYLNKTYLNDVEKYPEYLELAQSLVQLSKPHDNQSVARMLDLAQKHPHCLPEITHGSSAQSPISHNLGLFSAGDIQYSHSRVTQSTSKLLPISPEQSYEFKISSPPHMHNREEKNLPLKSPKLSPQKTCFVPITPPSVKDKTRLELMRSPPRVSQSLPRVCISCGSDQSPCWRPSWSTQEGQLCNSCGLRYKKTAARCLNSKCKKIPAKGEWALMQGKGKSTFEDGERAYGCLSCGWKVEVK